MEVCFFFPVLFLMSLKSDSDEGSLQERSDEEVFSADVCTSDGDEARIFREGMIRDEGGKDSLHLLQLNRLGLNASSKKPPWKLPSPPLSPSSRRTLGMKDPQPR